MFEIASTVDELTDVGFLSQLLGPVSRVTRSPFKTVGFSGTSHERLQIDLANGASRSLILKDIYSERDLSVWRTGNINGREARLLGERRLDGIWDIYKSPFLAYAFQDEHSGLLMHDLAGFLFPDVREPLRKDEEELLLKAFASLHAKFWERPILSDISWLGNDSMYFAFLAPNIFPGEQIKGHVSPVFEAADSGWKYIRTLIPDYLWEFLNTPAAELHSITAGLPKTLLHGDSKVANFAIDKDGRVNAFDWSMIAYGSSICEIGWYVTVNATRLSRSKEDVFRFYRNELEKNLGFAFSESDWKTMEATAVLSGAMSLLWSKALNLQKGLPGSKEEWNWWLDRIERVRNEYFS